MRSSSGSYSWSLRRVKTGSGHFFFPTPSVPTRRDDRPSKGLLDRSPWQLLVVITYSLSCVGHPPTREWLKDSREHSLPLGGKEKDDFRRLQQITGTQTSVSRDHDTDTYKGAVPTTFPKDYTRLTWRPKMNGMSQESDVLVSRLIRQQNTSCQLSWCTHCFSDTHAEALWLRQRF